MGNNDAAFLQALLANPADDGVRLIYADWLEEQGEPVSAVKAEFLRLTVQLATATGRKWRQKARRKRLQQLAAGLDTDWLAVVSRLAIENCQRKRKEAESPPLRVVQFEFLCDKRWEDLQPTEDRAVRFCGACRHNVHYCDTITEARNHAWARHCIAIDLGVIRREDDLEPAVTYLGRPSVATLRREEERMQPDPVSADRERRKQMEKGEGIGT